jgi:hypothetical protein
MNQDQAAAAFRAHTDAQPDVTVTLDLIPDTVMMEQVGQVEDALRLAYTALKAADYYTVVDDPDYRGVYETCPSCPARKGAAHADDCTLAAALAAIRALLPEVDGEEG